MPQCKGCGKRFPPARQVSPKVILTEEDLEELVEAYSQFEEFVFDVETIGGPDRRPHDEKPGLDVLTNKVIWISLAGPGRSDAIPIGHPHGQLLLPRHEEKYKVPDPSGAVYKRDGRREGVEWKAGDVKMVTRIRTVPAQFGPPPEQLPPGVVFGALRPLFFSDRRKIGANIKFDIETVRKYYDDEAMPGPFGDITVISHLLNENRHRHGLKELVVGEYSRTYGELGKAGVENYSLAEAACYSILDAHFTWKLWVEMYPRLTEEWVDRNGDLHPSENLGRVFDLEMDVLEVLVEMERHGVLIDRARLKAVGERLFQDMDEVKADVWRDAGREINLDNPRDKGWYVYEHRGHEPTVFTEKTGQPSTRAADLEVFAPRDKMVRRLLEYAEYQKLRSTYVESLLAHIGVDGALHANFKQTGTVTGRFSCSDPNLQNIPRVGGDKDAAASMIRQMFMAPAGHKLVVADYDQIELRVLAHFSNDPTMVRTFHEDLDPHGMTAALILDKPLGDITKEDRQVGKAQPISAPVLTPTGWKLIGDLAEGDAVIDPVTGGSTTVVGVYPQGVRPVYRVTFSDGAQTLCDEEHLWEVADRRGISQVLPLSKIKENYLVQRKDGRREYRYSVPLCAPVQWAERADLPIPPYTLGALLGDGAIGGPYISFSSEDPEVVERVREELPEHQVKWSDRCSYYITTGAHRGGRAEQQNTLQGKLRSLDLFGHRSDTKFIPERYLRASVDQRLALLQGLLDTDGYAAGAYAEFCSASQELAEGVQQLVRSLGGTARLAQGMTTHLDRYRVHINMPPGVRIFHLDRKWVAMSRQRSVARKIVNVEAASPDECVCIAVDTPKHLYVTSDYVVTHNTINFATVYGAGPRKVAGTIGCSERKARDFLDDYKERFPKVFEFNRKVVATARKRRPPHVRTLLGRKRRLPTIFSADDGLRYRAERQAVNTVIQGSAADIIKLAMVRLHVLLEDTPANLLLSVHDELVVVAPDDFVEQTIALMEEAMIIDGILDVPLSVEAKAGQTWAEAK